MDAGTLFWVVLIGGGLFAMFFMHRGGHAHGGHAHGGLGGCGGHGHGDPSSDKQEHEEGQEGDKKQPLGTHGSQGHKHEPATAGGKHRGC